MQPFEPTADEQILAPKQLSHQRCDFLTLTEVGAMAAYPICAMPFTQSSRSGYIIASAS